MPRMDKWGSLNEYDNVNTLFILYDVESGAMTATSKSNFYKDYAVELKEKFKKSFIKAKLKNTFNV